MASAAPGFDSLFTPVASARLSALERSLANGETDFAANARLRAEGLSGDEVAVLLTQATLRQRARAKFGEAASHMLFTPAGLEQASRAVVAKLHASRYVAAGCKRVADLGCGIGTESLALLGARISVLPVEIDPLTARVAEHNLGVSVWVGDAADAPLNDIDGVFLDPARRTAGHRDTRRVTNPADYSPSLDFAFGLAERMPTGIKLGPGFDRDLIPDTAEAQWVSVDGQVVEMGLWFGALSRPGVKRAALVVRGDTNHELVAWADSPDADVRALGEFLYEPDGAVIRARLIGLLAEQLESGMTSEGIAYLTSDTFVTTPFAQAFRVIEELPASEKQLKRSLKERGIGELEIKKRGADVDPAALRTRLRLRGPNSGTLVLTRAAGKHVALLVERV